MRLYAIPYSTNVERVTLALAHKGLDAEIVMCDPADRSTIAAVSGQTLVPVLDDDGLILSDSTVILRHLEARHPDPPLWPADEGRSAELDVFIDWFNRVWKAPPNAIADELESGQPDWARVRALEAELHASLELFEAMLAGRSHLFGDAFSAADCIAFPFLKYGLVFDPTDDEPFHRILIEHLAFGGSHPRLEEWVRNVDQRPRVA
ncbi:MAG: glutathione S-transferase family protein [Gaiellales bacterium]